MRRILSWTVGIAGVAAVGFLAARSIAPCALPPGLPGMADACALKTERIAAEKPSVPLPPVVNVAAAASLNFTERLFVSGTLVARDEAIVGAQIDGLRIIEVLAEDGDTVREGQVLARLDASQLEALLGQNDAALMRADAAIGQATSQIQQLQASRSWAESDLERSQKLGSGVVSPAVIDQKTTALNVARSQVEAAEGALAVAKADKASREAERRELKVRIGRTEVKAPVSGIVSRRTARLGAMASAAGEGLFRIITEGAVDLDAEVPAERMVTLKVGMGAEMRIPGIVAPVKGSVRLVSEEVDKLTRTGKVRIALAADSGARVGSFASGMVQIDQRSAIGIPASAVQPGSDGATVQVVKADMIELRKVKTGITDSGFTEIREGLAAGEPVVVRAAAFLRQGDLVRPKQVEAQTAMTAAGSIK